MVYTKMKPVALSVIAASMAVGLLSGCTSDNQKNSAEAGSGGAAKPIEIKWGIHFQATAVVADTQVQKWLEQNSM
ncbi:hypothetical protein [Paenibacillus ginsengarvi]|uniref:Uncharacterized protein n=1 Tax=Paenibacillus ginsengarvi TaxID=400777 RepID=A0A3B0BSG9_9BACL|nr:hypothetical protein [Paenibacillus ginsengarvi]RKN75842.1 hypothetical protein D7M11_25385 [Paenibacillus ginsengarvi]